MRQVGLPACLMRNLTTEYRNNKSNVYIQNKYKIVKDLVGEKKGLKKTVKKILLSGKISHEAMRASAAWLAGRHRQHAVLVCGPRLAGPTHRAS